MFPFDRITDDIVSITFQPFSILPVQQYLATKKHYKTFCKPTTIGKTDRAKLTLATKHANDRIWLFGKAFALSGPRAMIIIITRINL